MTVSLPGTLTWLLVAGSLALRLALACGPIENIDGYCLPDDAYLFLDLARSIGQGQGPFYGAAFTNGFQPLFAFLLAPAFWFHDGGDAPLRIALVGLSIVDTITLIALISVCRALFRGDAWVPCVLAAGWALNHNVLRNTLNGMETALAACLVVIAFAAHVDAYTNRRIEVSPRRAAWIGATVGIAMLARVDLSLFALASSVWISLRVATRRASIARPVPTILCYGLGASVAFVPWMIYSYYYTGDLYPISGEAIRFQANTHYELFPFDADPNWIHLRRAGGEVWRGNAVWLVAILVLGAACAVRRRARRPAVCAFESLAPLCLWSILLFLAYATYIHGTWFFHRYLFPIAIPIVLVGCALFHATTSGLTARARAVAGVVVSLALLLASRYGTRDYAAAIGVERWSASLTASQPRSGRFGYRAIGLWAKDRFPPGTVLGAKQSGAIGYFAEQCTVLNLDGVVNGSALYALKHHRAIPYLVEQDVDYVLLWELGEEFLTFLSPADGPRLVRIESVPEIHSWGNPGTNQWHVYRVE